jgi:hypothetical protein
MCFGERCCSSHTIALEDTEDTVACASQTSVSTHWILKPTKHRIFFFGDADGERAHTGDDLDLGNTVGVTEDDTDLGWGGALLGELADLVDDLLGGGLEPRGGVAGVGDGGGGDALALAVKTTHLDVLL